MSLQTLTPFLWFDNNAKEALIFYATHIKNSSLDFSPDDSENAMTYSATLNGQRVMALNGGPHFQLTPAFSFMIQCEDQAEVDHLWEIFTAEGEESMCGWLVDKFGLSWQIIPKQLYEYLGDPDLERAQRAFAAMRQMKKLDIAKLAAAAANFE